MLHVRRGRFSTEIAAGALLIGILIFLAACGVQVPSSPPTAAQRESDFLPRGAVDTSGFSILAEMVPRWDPDHANLIDLNDLPEEDPVRAGSFAKPLVLLV